MPTESVIRCEQLGRRFTNAAGGVVDVLQAIDLEVCAGEFLVIIGASGCGKSTLLNILAGFDRATSGTVHVRGRAIERPGPDRAMVFQDYALLPWLNALGNVEIGLRLQGVPRAERRAAAQRALELVGLGDALTRPVYKLSGGMQQRVSIARALALKPTVLLMDEPFGALDAFARGAMHRELKHSWAATGTTIVFVTHSLDEALALGTRIVAMAPGRRGFSGVVDLSQLADRDPFGAEFIALKHHLFELVSGELQAEGAFVE